MHWSTLIMKPWPGRTSQFDLHIMSGCLGSGESFCILTSRTKCHFLITSLVSMPIVKGIDAPGSLSFISYILSGLSVNRITTTSICFPYYDCNINILSIFKLTSWITCSTLFYFVYWHVTIYYAVVIPKHNCGLWPGKTDNYVVYISC